MDKLSTFEERFVAFVDILGFKEIVENSINNIDYQNKVSKVLEYIAKIRNDTYQDTWAKNGEQLYDVSVFSDSIIISYPCDKRSSGDGLFYLLLDIIHLCFVLMQNGIYVRGGITVGNMIHNENIIWGPAVVKAYELEGQDAVYPRIIVDKQAIERGKELYKRWNPLDLNGHGLDDLVKLDDDGLYFLDYLSQRDEFDYEYDYIRWLECVRKSIEDNLSKDYSSRIKMKYVWFARYYNKTVKTLNNSRYQGKLIDINMWWFIKYTIKRLIHRL